MKFLIKVFSNFVNLLQEVDLKINKFKESRIKGKFELDNITYNSTTKRYSAVFLNKSDIRGLEFLQYLWKSLNSLNEWNLHDKKVMIIAFIDTATNKSYFIHKNVLITRTTTFQMYYTHVEKFLQIYWEIHSVDIIDSYRFIVVHFSHIVDKKSDSNKKVKFRTKLVKELIKDNKKYYHTSVNNQINKNWLIKPLKIAGLNKNAKICVLKFETIKLNSNIQIPVAISFAYPNLLVKQTSENRTVIKSFVVLIDNKLLLTNIEEAVNKLWNEFHNKLINLNLGINLKIYTQFLGSIDGYLILSSLYKITENIQNISSIIDNNDKFVYISYTYNTYPYLDVNKKIKNNKNLTDNDRLKSIKHKWTFLDIYRLFPLSLEDLCKIFNVKNKVISYNQEWNSIKLFNSSKLLKEFIKYSKQDSVRLLNVILKARKIYIKQYNIDISKSVSTPSLSFLIYRYMFQTFDIPILKRNLDKIIRESYYWRDFDYYKLWGRNLKYYKVNSLYPYAMLKDLPLNYLGEFTNIKLEDCFGFIECIVTCPSNIKYPLLIHNYKGRIIHPTGTWKGVYFSEELKEVVKYGYIITVIKAYQFSKAQLFTDYIEHFYDKKNNSKSTGAKRYIAELHLNNLYGVLGRKLDVIKTIAVRPEQIIDVISIHPIKNYFQINPNLWIILAYQHLDYSLINNLNADLPLLKLPYQIVKSNVAIASAITAYARIEMMKYKTLPGINIYYTDTDSIFVDKELPKHLIGKELGQMKEKKHKIKEAYFLGTQKYAYINNENIVKSVFSIQGWIHPCIENYITWDEVKQIVNHKNFTKQLPNQFVKSLQTLEISIKDINVNITLDKDKELFKNKYFNINIFDIKKSKLKYITLHLISNFWNNLKKWLKKFYYPLMTVVKKYNKY